MIADQDKAAWGRWRNIVMGRDRAEGTGAVRDGVRIRWGKVRNDGVRSGRWRKIVGLMGRGRRTLSVEGE